MDLNNQIPIMASSGAGGVHDFYDWSRDYWTQLSRSPEGHPSHALNFGLWNPGISNLYDAQENFRQTIFGLLGEFSPTARGLEVGCGIGGFAVKLVAEKRIRLTCVDLLNEHLALAKDLALSTRTDSFMEFRQGNSMALPFESETFDFVYCIESSFHYPNKEKFLNEIYRVLKSGGLFVFADMTCEDNSQVTFRKGNYFPSHREIIAHIETSHFSLLKHISIGSHVFVPLRDYVKQYNTGQRSKLTKYWEIVLGNYAKLSKKKLMDYEIFQLYKP